MRIGAAAEGEVEVEESGVRALEGGDMNTLSARAPPHAPMTI